MLYDQWLKTKEKSFEVHQINIYPYEDLGLGFFILTATSTVHNLQLLQSILSQIDS